MEHTKDPDVVLLATDRLSEGDTSRLNSRELCPRKKNRRNKKPKKKKKKKKETRMPPASSPD